MSKETSLLAKASVDSWLKEAVAEIKRYQEHQPLQLGYLRRARNILERLDHELTLAGFSV